MEIRKATIADVAEMQRLINAFADRGELLHRSLNQLYENIRDFYVLEEEGRVLGTCALHVNWGDLAEIMALTVDESCQGRGLGRRLIEACLDESRALGIYRVFALTYKPEFFVKHGFRYIEKSDLPQKVWTECINCVKFPDCGEVAVIRDLE
ncbi:MAG: N-acetyltransferase [Armatimonadetes bacterium]|nr:N-acetyltransferase [Armatimonadota bacterium]